MISYPSIDKLLDQVNSRYSLSVLAAMRAHEIDDGDSKMLTKYESPRSVGQALEEIADGKVKVDPSSILSERKAERVERIEETKLEHQEGLENKKD
ncbi:MAG: DNA-directed RNA polymerase subunit omega [Lactobacillus sp.]|uniref:DNA-directed RNA polymerase subunit omega n=1 Tax=Bombilactobacillus bombi TaxID=1303590 RepID=A0A347SQM9_9LACO|nr:DNA-directed RNA polymerase subunit omega [Bombilactobacillus bombi]MCO6541653.1 DNA-directed RNA polymerase subunit omega [Lactobacillus sp.]AXX64338.1 DNA-directed RNA polymerase subunit omega [Bombilactobacillus bombi]MCO6543035.1 DNA-directed RNA polymerase subunit omega [Lactobacillus sp.]RHW48329.1 DNA-directed RNA polymerase subunit omega [Bombilactobacillus bombi]RHW49636.1 DNA-directed RNA polymerase subunit omega [Bombilactobacillus bombi]